MSVILTPAIKQHLPLLSDMQKRAFFPLYQAFKDKSNPYLKGEKQLFLWLNGKDMLMYTVFADGAIAGAVAFNRLKKGVYHLVRVFVAPEFQRRGIAFAAVSEALNELPEPECVTVDFPVSLQANLNLYSKLGFSDTGRRVVINPALTLAVFIKYFH